MKLTKEQQTERENVVDELGSLELKISELDPDVARAKILRAQVESWTEKTTAAASVSYSGKKFVANCGPRKNERTVDVPGLRELLGDGFFEVASVALGQIDKVAARLPQVLKFVKTTKTGKRTITTAQKAA